MIGVSLYSVIVESWLDIVGCVGSGGGTRDLFQDFTLVVVLIVQL